MERASGRTSDQIRNIKISYNVFGYAPGSVLFELGNTKILCTVTLQPGVPPFLKGSKTGWLTAEYAMLPTATKSRVQRDSSTVKKNSRSVEISRLIGRALRSVVNLEKLGERTLIVDCDVLQADGSTRTAAISGSYLALCQAVHTLLQERTFDGILSDYITDAVAAVSVGIRDGQPLLDIDFGEDSTIDADYNFVLTESGNIIEIQGSAERATVAPKEFDAMHILARKGVSQLLACGSEQKRPYYSRRKDKAPLFSLVNRQNSV